jgi:hypothetical protein
MYSGKCICYDPLTYKKCRIKRKTHCNCFALEMTTENYEKYYKNFLKFHCVKEELNKLIVK